MKGTPVSIVLPSEWIMSANLIDITLESSTTVKMKTALDTSVPKFLALVMSLYCPGCPESTLRNLPSTK